MAQRISPCIWFDSQAEAAAKLYTSIFKGKIRHVARYGKSGAQASGRPEGSVMTVVFDLGGYEIMGLNGGPMFQVNPSVSFSVACKDKKEIDTIYKKLVAGGSVLMPLQAYEWSERYCWIRDRYGVSWQLSIGKSRQKITPSLLFCGPQQGNAAKAIRLYTSAFPKSRTLLVAKYPAGPTKGQVMYAHLSLGGDELVAMDSGVPQDFTFNEAMSLMIYCKDQREIDHYWSKLKKGGKEGPCGWLTDRYGVSWQLVPRGFDKLMKGPKAEKAMAALMTMKKPDIAKLKAAAK